MKTITQEYNIYNYDELEKKSQARAVNEHIGFIIETTNFDTLNRNSNLYKAYRRSELMQTPWFIGEYIWELCKKMVLDEVRSYDYLEDGKVFV